MKKISLILAVGFLMVGLNSCEKEPEELILGDWKVENIESSAIMNDAEKEAFNMTVDEQKQFLTYTFEQTSMTMKYDDETSEWSWALSGTDDDMTLTLSNEQRRFEYSVVELSDKKLIWQDEAYGHFDVTTTLVKK